MVTVGFNRLLFCRVQTLTLCRGFERGSSRFCESLEAPQSGNRSNMSCVTHTRTVSLSSTDAHGEAFRHQPTCQDYSRRWEAKESRVQTDRSSRDPDQDVSHTEELLEKRSGNREPESSDVCDRASDKWYL